MCALAEIDIYILTIFEDVCLWYVSIYVCIYEYIIIYIYTHMCYMYDYSEVGIFIYTSVLTHEYLCTCFI